MRRSTKAEPSHTLAEVTVMDVERLDPLCIESVEARGTRELARSRDKFRIRFAGGNSNYTDTTMLIEKMYSWRGYAGKVDLDGGPNRITLNAEFRGRIFGTITLNIDSPMGLAAEAVFPEMIRALRQKGCKLCEFSKFAVEQTVKSKRLLANLFYLAYLYGHRLHGCTDAVIEVNPRHVAFYRRYLEFEVWGEQRLCPRVNAPAVLMRLDFVRVTEPRIRELGGRWNELLDEKSFYKYAMAPREEEFIIQRLLERGDRRVA